MAREPSPFLFGSPEIEGVGRVGSPGAGGRGRIERVARLPVSWLRIVLIDTAVTAYGVVVVLALASVARADPEEFREPGARIALAVAGLVLVAIVVAFGHLVLQYVGLLGVLYARAVPGGWELGPLWGFVLPHRITLRSAETLRLRVDELTPRERRGRNYGEYRWRLSTFDRTLQFRTPAGAPPTVRDQIDRWSSERSCAIEWEDATRG